MPMIDLTLEQGALGDRTKAQLVEDLTETLLKWEGVPGNETARNIAWVYVDERPAGTMNVAGKPAAEPHYRVRLTVPEGALDDERKQGLVAEVTRQVLAAAGADPEDPAALMRVWAFVNEIPDGNWGALGQVVRFRDIAKYVGSGGKLEQPAELAPAS